MGAKVFNLRRKDLNTKFKKYVKAYNLTSELELSISVQFSSVTQSCPTLCDTMNRSTPGLPVLSPNPGVHSDSRPLSPWCHPAISSSVVPFSCPQSLPASGSLVHPYLLKTETLSLYLFISKCVLFAHFFLTLCQYLLIHL